MDFHNVSELVAALNEEEGIGYMLVGPSKGDAMLKAIVHMNVGIDAGETFNLKGYVGENCI